LAVQVYFGISFVTCEEAMPEESGSLRGLKQAMRVRAQAARSAQPNKDALSRVICGKFAALPEYAAAATVMFYVDMRSEVRTRELLSAALGQEKRIVVPCCLGDRLALFVLESMEELAAGTYGILEPRRELRALAQRRADACELDLVMVPGVAFDRQGGRLGHGKGYYDKLLRGVRPDAALVALAFECQVFPEIPTGPHDVCMDKVITEKAVYQGRGRQGGLAGRGP
jgi:5-formyltetrahydrofolate cyclo-ligase